MKYPFQFPMNKRERALGCVYIIIHALVLPELLVMITGLFSSGATVPYQMLIYYTTSFLITLIIMFKFLRSSFSDFIGGFWRAVQAVILGYVMYRALLWIIIILLTRIMSSDNPNTQAVNAALDVDFRIMIVVTVVLAPIVEETIFRGALFGTLRQKNRVLAYVASILIFAAYHLWAYFLIDFSWDTVLYGIQYIPASIALAWCYERGGTIWSPILLHAAINLGGILQTR